MNRAAREPNSGPDECAWWSAKKCPGLPGSSDHAKIEPRVWVNDI